jgi:importin subunit beta-1
MLTTLHSNDKGATTAAAQCIAAVAEIEIPRNQWPDCIQILLNNMTSNSKVKQASLQAIGFICESCDPMALAHQSNSILTAVVQGARKEESK